MGNHTQRSAFEHLTSGAFSGFSSAIALQPLDVLKTRIQQMDGAGGKPQSTLAITKEITSQSGIRGLWRGTVPTLSRNVPGVAMYFYLLQTVRRNMANVPLFSGSPTSIPTSSTTTLTKLSSQGNLLAGALTRLGVGLVLNPFTVVKTRFESNLYSYKSMAEALQDIWRQSGPSGLLQGFKASALRDAPYAGIFVLFYELIKERSTNIVSRNWDIPAPWIHTWSGASAGMIATLATHPFDVVKTKMQIQPGNYRYRSVTSTAFDIFKARGLLGLFDGGGIRISRKVLSSAISWTVYESLLLFMNQTK
ncbi:hypothetical protein FRC03_009732 [Tulasnella sp. 419]|nr:hypothetical protein FRC03_009732 [Tulasnella sp. 419]